MAEQSVDWWKELSVDWNDLIGVSSDTSNVPTTFQSHLLPINVEAPLMFPPSQTLEHMQFHSNKGRRITWTKAEHKRFLEGLDIYGKGNWKNISAYIQTKSASQVASHAQKYFIRQSKSKEEKKRKSIHDMVIENTTHTNIHIQNSSSIASSLFYEMQPQQQVIPFNPQINMSHLHELNHINMTYRPREEMINQNHMNSNNIIDYPANFNQMQSSQVIPFNAHINRPHPPELFM
ncbi:hypothetical protein LR48_Vigan09g117500 [Vigna angularis]|uniref:Transcription factor n=2 Tax=Phaseolus angularis TaxID=3914 RepID=A0A0L9VBS7_PHAAN|nr:Transcription factor [Vigna angularis]KOM52516.1 hypothetical protein LR48_Vigan09g117500 [Vigna angularis]BAT88404.1 hypothetical protein VIGAN_05188700 [Vigna angularis var. angularis]